MQVKGLDLDGWTLAEVRRRVRGQPEGGDIESPPPGRNEPERISAILERMGFGNTRGQDDERD